MNYYRAIDERIQEEYNLSLSIVLVALAVILVLVVI